MAVWNRKKVEKEVHPLVKFSSIVRVKEFSEHHPSSFFKIRPSHAKNETDKKRCQDCVNNHSIIMIPSSSSDTSSITAVEQDSTEPWAEQEGIEPWAEIEEDTKALAEQEGTEVWEEDSEITGQWQDEIGDSDSEEDCEEQECVINFGEDSCTEAEEPQVRRDKKPKSASSIAKSFKITWTFRRKKKKRLRIVAPQRSRKFLFLGDMNCGKSNLITTYCKDRFFEDYHPTILHFCVSDTKVMGRKIDIILADTSGRNDFKPLRQCAYYKTDIAILCYSAEDRNTLERIRSYWLPELQEHAPHCPFIIVETKKDIRDEFEDKKLLLEREGKTETSEYRSVCKNLTERIVSEGLGAGLAKELGAAGFFKTSALYRAGTRKMIESATKVAVKKTRRKRTI